MKFLKGLALSLLSILLFISLSVFGLVLTVNQTILNPDFVVSQVNKMDISSLAEEFISEQLSAQIPSGSQQLTASIVEDVMTDLEPWIKEQANAAVYTFYDYLTGKSQSLRVEIPTAELKETLESSVKSAFLKALPPELAGAPPAMIDAAFEQYYQQFAQQIPATFDITEDLLGTEGMSALEQAREYIGYIQTAYKALIAIILVLIGLIVLIHRQVRGSTRQIGITFLTYGIPALVSFFILKNYAMTQMTQLAQFNLPASFQAWLPQFFNDLLAPLEMFSLGVLIGGAVLLIISFVYKPRQSSY